MCSIMYHSISLMKQVGFMNVIWYIYVQIDRETVETVRYFIFLGSKVTAAGDCSHKIKRQLLLRRKVMIT